MTNDDIMNNRFKCPCCGYPTLGERNAYEICELCNWEDDGQDDDDVDIIKGGPNSDYSLKEARQNFKLYRVMYAPDRDQRITGRDSTLEYETKGQLIAIFKRLQSSSPSEISALEVKIGKLEQLLRNETTRQVEEYERQQKKA